MKKVLLIVLLIVPLTVFAVDKFLHYKFNDKVVITISNIDCPLPKLKKDFPLAVVASRVDGQKLFGCFSHNGDEIVIQWAAGDQTKLPANVFLQELEPNT